MAKNKFNDANGEGPNIGLRGIYRFMRFGAHIEWGADIIILRECRGVKEVAKSKVAKDIPAFGYKDVGRFDIPMYDSVKLQARECLGDLEKEVEYVRLGKYPLTS